MSGKVFNIEESEHSPGTRNTRTYKKSAVRLGACLRS
jgi:hypothetical protein